MSPVGHHKNTLNFRRESYIKNYPKRACFYDDQETEIYMNTLINIQHWGIAFLSYFFRTEIFLSYKLYNPSIAKMGSF